MVDSVYARRERASVLRGYCFDFEEESFINVCIYAYTHKPTYTVVLHVKFCVLHMFILI